MADDAILLPIGVFIIRISIATRSLLRIKDFVIRLNFVVCFSTFSNETS